LSITRFLGLDFFGLFAALAWSFLFAVLGDECALPRS
jgi:hypothetical protein